MKKLFLILACLAVLLPARAGWMDALNLGKSTNATSSVTSAAVAALSDTQVIGGLKDALGKGLQNAVAKLGSDGGFLTNMNVKIPLPEKLKLVEKSLRALKQDKYADEFVATMNRAAEQAVPEAASVFGDAMKSMSIADAKAVLTGPNDSATQFFRRTTQTNLYTKFLPIVQQATAKAGVTSAYKNMLSKVNAGNTSTNSTGWLGKLGGLTKNYVGEDVLDVDAYVTNKTLEGLFKMIAAEEKDIRENPAARTTDLMKQVFGAVTK